MKPDMRWLDKVKSTLQPDEPQLSKIPTPRLPRIRKRVGRCYELAFLGCLQTNSWQIIHAEICDPYNFATFGHAWLEHSEQVYDPVRDEFFDKTWYINFLSAQNMVSYSWAEACEIMLQCGHYGPWGLEDRV